MKSLADILQNILIPEPESLEPISNPPEPLSIEKGETQGRYDFDLAEFPMFHYEKTTHSKRTEPILYTDTIKGKDGAEIIREWKVYPSAVHGFGNSSTQLVLYELLQLWVDQGCKGSQIQFGTLRSHLMRRSQRRPSSKDFERLRRDLEILCGCRFHCKNAFWDRNRGAYVDMNWQLFTSVFYFREKAGDMQSEMPFGFIEASSVLQQIARSRGFFSLGFPKSFIYKLSPLEQRLAVYLAKKFLSQKLHQRFVEDLATALPIEAERADNVRAILRRTVNGLQKAGFPLLESFEFRKSERDGRWVAVFRRKASPKQYALPKDTLEKLDADLQILVERLSQASGQPDDWRWWMKCAQVLGYDGITRAIGQFEETVQIRRVDNRGAMLTKILKDVAADRGVALN